MKTRPVEFTGQAQADLLALEVWLEAATGKSRARRNVDRLDDFCERLDLASERGTHRYDLMQGLRIIGFERRLTIAFAVHEDRVDILRVFRAGRDWEAEFDEG